VIGSCPDRYAYLDDACVVAAVQVRHATSLTAPSGHLEQRSESPDLPTPSPAKPCPAPLHRPPLPELQLPISRIKSITHPGLFSTLSSLHSYTASHHRAVASTRNSPLTMKKFGLKKEQGGEPDDANRSALFGRRNPKIGTSDPSKNPYAAASSPDPYARDNQSGGYGAPPAYDGRGERDQRRAEKSPVPPGGYGGGRDEQRGNSGYGGAGAYGGQGGYGSDRYDSQPSTRRGGYGGMGGSRDTIGTDAGRSELFGNAAQRLEQRQQTGYGGDQQSGIGAEDGGYGSYQDREMTAEEAEEEDVKATKVRYLRAMDLDRAWLTISRIKFDSLKNKMSTARETWSELHSRLRK